tara:strand:- start:7140 stop:7508 length:369 start_codon:yes stop_codon:yes gene_type:complete
MASILRVNTITDASSNNSIATSVLFNGSAKAWNNVTQGTSAIQDSYNISSISDDSTGTYTQNYTSNMSNTGFSVSGTCQNAGHIGTTGTFGSSSTQLITVITTNANANDYDDACNSVHGDLA